MYLTSKKYVLLLRTNHSYSLAARRNYLQVISHLLLIQSSYFYFFRIKFWNHQILILKSYLLSSYLDLPLLSNPIGPLKGNATYILEERSLHER